MKKYTEWIFPKSTPYLSTRQPERAAQKTERLSDQSVTYSEFFQNAPCLNEKRSLITGVVCGVRVETIEEPLMREIRYLDKLIDELAKGKVLEKVMRK